MKWDFLVECLAAGLAAGAAGEVGFCDGVDGFGDGFRDEGHEVASATEFARPAPFKRGVHRFRRERWEVIRAGRIGSIW